MSAKCNAVAFFIISSMFVVCTDSNEIWAKPGGHVTSGVTGRVPAQRLLTGKFLLTYRENRGKEKKEGKGGKMEKKRRKIVKGKLEN